MADSSSMAASGSPAAEFLTPRSKVAKMLADIDDEVENAPTPSPSAKRPSKAIERESTTQTATSPENADKESDSFTTEKSASNRRVPFDLDSDDDDDVIRPQGRAARRMMGARMEDAPNLDLLPGSANMAPLNKANAKPDDDEDELYSATPMKKRSRQPRPVSTSPPGSEKSQGLFVSPTKSVDQDSEDELPDDVFGGKNKLAELIAQKRAERLAREAEEKQRKKDAAHSSSDLPEEAFEGSQELPPDPDVDKIMSEASRPSRKASKKALLEMERETQRLARQQALAHQMKVKKKFTTSDLFAKFNFRQSNAVQDAANERAPEGGDTTASSAPNSDGAEERTKEPVSTPPSSPPSPLDRQRELVELGALSKLVPVREDSIATLAGMDDDDDDELPDLAEIIRSSQRQQTVQPSEQPKPLQPEEKKGLKFARLGKKAAPRHDNGSDDDELDILPSLPRHLRMFDQAQTSARTGKPADSRAIHNLKHLSNLHSHESAPSHRKKGPTLQSINPQTLEFQLRRRAKEQARQQQLERIEELRAKGIEVQTSEEREKEAEAFENLLEKARNDAVELRKAEKAARREGRDEGAAVASDDEDEEDGDFVGSGSDEEDDEREDNGLVDEVAEETDEEEGDEEDLEHDGADDEVDMDELAAPEAEPQDFTKDLEKRSSSHDKLNTPAPRARLSRKSRIITDEDDDDVAENLLSASAKRSTQEDDPFAAFNFDSGPNGVDLLSPTQAFHATMQTPTQQFSSQHDSMEILRRIAPTSSLPSPSMGYAEDTQLSFIPGSQVPESQRVELNLDWETQPAPETPRVGREMSAMTETPGWEPTQDEGISKSFAGALRGAAEDDEDHETQSTVQLRVSESPAPSQSVQKRGKLGRRQIPIAPDESDSETEIPASIQPKQRNAFAEMARRRREALTAGEKADAEREMREMMDEAAEESEDEYAGLGGDDYVAPETEQDKEMIDSSHIDVDERALAAHFAERQRQRDEAETEKLYKDVTTGMLRRKMAANAFDLDEDEDEVAVRRRQMRQREEARKRKALLKDERVANLVEGKGSKGKDAFLKAIADDDDGDEGEADVEDEIETPIATQDASQSQLAEAPLKETSGNKRKLPDTDQEDRPPAKQRRTQPDALRRPTSLLEVQESVSFLLDEPHVGVAAPTTVDLSSDDEDEYGSDPHFSENDEDPVEAEEARNNDGGFAPNTAATEAMRTQMQPPRLPASQRRTGASAVVDRLALKRNASSETSALGRTAWAAGPGTGGFKVPSLLRRATTSSTSSSSTTTPNLSRENSTSGGAVKMGGTKKSSLAYQARAEERRAIVDKARVRREENTRRVAEMRRKSAGGLLGRGLGGSFE